MIQGCIFLISPPPGGGQIWRIGCMGKKYDDLLRKNANIGGKRWKTGKKGKSSLYVGEKNIIFDKRGGGKNIFFWANIHPCMLQVGLKHFDIVLMKINSRIEMFYLNWPRCVVDLYELSNCNTNLSPLLSESTELWMKYFFSSAVRCWMGSDGWRWPGIRRLDGPSSSPPPASPPPSGRP